MNALRLSALALLLAAAPASGQAGAEEAAADIAARAALPRAEIRMLMPEIRTIQGLDGAVGGAALSITGDVVGIAQAQRTLTAGGLTTRMVDGSLEVSLPGDVLFDFDKATIRASAIATLEQVRSAAQSTGARAVRIEGHTDALGTAARNQPLSEARARAVADWLATAGIARARLTAQGFGASRPVAPNRTPAGTDDPAGRQKNRRVTIIL